MQALTRDGIGISRGAKRGVFALLVLALIAVLFTGITVKAYADGGATITVGSSGEVTAGDEFTVPVTIADNTGFAAAAFEFTYNSNALELTGFSTDGLIGNGLIPNVAGNSAGYFSSADITDNGVLFSATFKVKDDAGDGTYDIKLGLRNNTASNMVNSSAKPVTVTFVDGSADVTGTGKPTTTASTDTTGNTGTGDTSTTTGTGDTSTTTGTGADATDNTGTGSTSTSTDTTTGSTVTATAADGSQISFMMRSNSSGSGLEYSLDNGTTWTAVPDNGIITTDEGKTISVDGTQSADYVVDATTTPSTTGTDTSTTATDTSSGGLSTPVILGIVAVVVVIVVIAIILVARSSSSKKKTLKALDNNQHKE